MLRARGALWRVCANAGAFHPSWFLRVHPQAGTGMLMAVKVAMVLGGVLNMAGALGCTIDGVWHYGDEEYTLAMDSKGKQTGEITATVVPGHKGHCT